MSHFRGPSVSILRQKWMSPESDKIGRSDNTMQKRDRIDTPLSQSSVSLKLSLIRKQCEKLMEEGRIELSLEDPAESARPISDSFNPYDRGK